MAFLQHGERILVVANCVQAKANDQSQHYKTIQLDIEQINRTQCRVNEIDQELKLLLKNKKFCIDCFEL